MAGSNSMFAMCRQFHLFRDALVAYFTNSPAPSLLSVNP
jgi:hypothetical protein